MACMETVPLRGILSPGAVIGKAGRNVKWIKQQAGGGVRLNIVGDEVQIVSYSRDAVHHAAQLLRAQIDANERLGEVEGGWLMRIGNCTQV